MRTSGTTQIFKTFYNIKEKELSVDHLFTLTPLTSGGVSHHADVAFNPWYASQVGTIDETGNWRVWDINHKIKSRKNMKTPITHVAGGRVTAGDEESGDGWGRFSWAGDFNTVMACDRSTAALFDTRVQAHMRRSENLS